MSMKTSVVMAIALAVFIVVAIVAMLLLTRWATPEEFTETRMIGAKVRIQKYVAEHHRLPARLGDVPKWDNPNRDSSLDDWWGRPIIYEPQANWSFILSSYGESGKPGSKDSIIMRCTIDEVTEYRMFEVRERIRAYFAEQHRLPVRLTALPKSDDPHRENSLDDGWGRPIVYEPQADGSFVLSTYGESGKPGSKDSIIMRCTVNE